MPCYTNQRVSVDAGKMNLTILTEAVKGLGWNVAPARDGILKWGVNQYDTQTGVLAVGTDEEVNEIKRAYSEQVVKSQAARFGWSVKKQQDGKLLVMKGKF